MTGKKIQKEDKDECGSCCSDPHSVRPPMSSMCYAIGGILSIFAGFVFLLGAFGQIPTMTLYVAVGVLLMFHGLGGVLHVIRACPMCKAK